MNLKIIEVIGPPGAGKTTLRDNITLHHNANKDLPDITTEKKALKFPKKEIYNSIINAMNLEEYILRSSILTRKFYRSPNDFEIHDALVMTVTKWSQFLEFCIADDLPNVESVLQRIYGLEFFIKTLKIRALLETIRDCDKIILTDEPLSYRLSMFSRIPRNKEREKKYYELMPLPDGIIHLNVCLKTVLSRIISRKKINGQVAKRHFLLNDAEILQDITWAKEVAKTGAIILESRGVPVLWLDDETELDELVFLGSDFIINKIIKE